MIELEFMGHDLEVFVDDDGNLVNANLNGEIFSEMLNDFYYEKLENTVAKYWRVEEQNELKRQAETKLDADCERFVFKKHGMVA